MSAFGWLPPHRDVSLNHPNPTSQRDIYISRRIGCFCFWKSKPRFFPSAGSGQATSFLRMTRHIQFVILITSEGSRLSVKGGICSTIAEGRSKRKGESRLVCHNSPEILWCILMAGTHIQFVSNALIKFGPQGVLLQAPSTGSDAEVQDQIDTILPHWFWIQRVYPFHHFGVKKWNKLILDSLIKRN